MLHARKNCKSIKFIFTPQLIIVDCFLDEIELFLCNTFIGRVAVFNL